MQSIPHSSPSPTPSPPLVGAATTTATATAAATEVVEAFPQPQQQQFPAQMPAADAAHDSAVPAAPTATTTRDRSRSTPPSNLLSSLAAAMASSPSPVIPTSSPSPVPSPAGTALHSQRPNTTGTTTVFTSLDDDHPTSLAAVAAHKRKSRSIGNIHALHSVSENVVSVSPNNDADPLGRRRSSVASNVSSNNVPFGAASGGTAQTFGTLPPPVPPISLPTTYSNTLPRSPSDGLRSSSNRPTSVVMGTAVATSHAPAPPEHHVSLSPEEPPKQLSSDDAPEGAATSAAAVPSASAADTQESHGSQATAHDGAREKGGEDTEDLGASTANIPQTSSSQQEPPTHSTSGTLAKLQRRFQRHFPALSSESVISAHSCSMEKMNKEEHWVGRMYITDRHLCFQGKLDKYIAKVNVRYADVISVQSLRDGASAGNEDGGKAGPVVGVKVMSLVSKYSFSNFQNEFVPIQEIRAQWQATQSHAAALQQASQRRLDILMRPPSIVARNEPSTSSTSYQLQSPPPINSTNANNSALGAPSPGRPLPIPKPSPARSTTTLAASSATTATAVLVAPEPKHSTQPSSGIAVVTHPTGTNPGLSVSRPSTSSGSISNTTSIPTLTGIAPIGGTPPVLSASAAIVNGGALVVPAPSVPAPLPPVAQPSGNGSSLSVQLSAIPSMEATAGTAGTAFRGFFNRMVKSKRSESATGSGSMSTSNNAAVMAAAAAAVAAGPPASSSSSSTSLTKARDKSGSRDVAPSTSSSDIALVASNASVAAKPAAPSKPMKSYTSTCACNSLTPLKHSVLAPVLVPTSAKQVWLALFGPSAPVYQSAHKSRETERMDLPEWPAPNSNDVPVVGTQRTVSYRISFYLPLKGKQSADSTESQKVVSVLPTDGSTSPTAWIVEYSTKTPDVPSGGSFTTQARVCVNQIGPNKTSIHVQFAVNFHEKVRFIQGQIEQGGVDGCSALWKEIAQGLKNVPADAEDLESAAVASAINGPSPVTEEPIVIEAPASEGPIALSVPGSAAGSPSKIGGSGGPGGPATRRQPLAILHSGSVMVERLVRLVVSKPRKLKKYLLITAIVMTLVNALYAVWLAGQVVSLLPELSTGARSASQRGHLAPPPSTAASTTTSVPKAHETEAADASGAAGKEAGELVKAGAQKDATAILLDTWSKSLQARAESLQAELSALRAAAAVIGGDSQKR